MSERPAALPPGAATSVAALGAVATFSVGTVPTLFAAGVADGSLSVDLLGIASAAQSAAVLVAVSVCGAALPLRGLRRIAVAALLVLATAFALSSLTVEPVAFTALRALAGTAEGVLLWMTMAGTVRTSSPVRIMAVSILGAGLVRIALVFGLNAAVIPHLGAGAGWLVLAALPVLALPAVRWMPRAFDRVAIADASAPRRRLPLVGVASLATVLLIAPGVQVLTLYAGPLAVSAGADEAGTSLTLTLMSVGNLLGGLAAVVIGSRTPYLGVFAVTVALVGLLSGAAPFFGPLVLAIALGATSAAHFFRNPYFVGQHLFVDPSGRTALFHTPTVMIANVLAQAVSSLLVAGMGLHAVIAFVNVTGIVGLAVMVLLHRSVRRAAERPD